jgi:thiamine biosynthesis lipoprotein
MTRTACILNDAQSAAADRTCPVPSLQIEQVRQTETAMAASAPTRRRAIGIFAATTAALLIDGLSRSAAGSYEWRGLAMGADAKIVLSGIAEDHARAAIARIVPEIARLEQVLSLFQQDSEISRLNRSGYLRHPTADLRAALTLALHVSEVSDGLFDPTVQWLWEANADWFAAHPDAGLPPRHVVAAACQHIGWQRIAVSPAEIRLGEGQRITLNGLGQGYVTDRIAELLRQRGFVHVLVDLGEQRALGPQSSGAAWIVARDSAAPIALREGALATSEGAGCVFGAGGRAHHLFDPRNGQSASLWRGITVHHRSAAIADALSTALYAATEQELERTLARFPGAWAVASRYDGHERVWATPLAHGAQRLTPSEPARTAQ